jgi:V-type H+-transporting ATPase subunit F
VTGFLLADIGKVSIDGSTNFLIVNDETSKLQIENAFKDFTTRTDIALLIIAQTIANDIRKLIDEYDKVIPAIIEIPSKDSPYDPKKDSILIKANKILGKGDD